MPQTRGECRVGHGESWTADRDFDDRQAVTVCLTTIGCLSQRSISRSPDGLSWESRRSSVAERRERCRERAECRETKCVVCKRQPHSCFQVLSVSSGNVDYHRPNFGLSTSVSDGRWEECKGQGQGLLILYCCRRTNWLAGPVSQGKEGKNQAVCPSRRQVSDSGRLPGRWAVGGGRTVSVTPCAASSFLDRPTLTHSSDRTSADDGA